jgi:sigma-B regulation protein RsbU (phosphoserine phosphatase)
MPIGFFPKMAYSGGTAQVKLPATLYVYSDGVYEVERPGGAMWSWQELHEFLAKRTGGIENEIDALRRHLQEMSGSSAFDDDFSVLKVSFH